MVFKKVNKHFKMRRCFKCKRYQLMQEVLNAVGFLCESFILAKRCYLKQKPTASCFTEVVAVRMWILPDIFVDAVAFTTTSHPYHKCLLNFPGSTLSEHGKIRGSYYIFDMILSFCFLFCSILSVFCSSQNLSCLEPMEGAVMVPLLW